MRAVCAALERCDAAALRELAFAKHGFCSAELRRAVWIVLLGLSPAEAGDGSWRRVLAGVDEEGQDARVIRNDVQRSVYTWDVHANIRKTARNQKRAQLAEVNRHHKPRASTCACGPLSNGWALCPAWFPKVSQAAQHVIYVAVRAPARP